jgi:hypothetical protein
MAEQFVSSTAKTRAFDIVADLHSYPTAQALESKLRQLRPEVVLLDVASNLDTAAELIRHATALTPSVHIIGRRSRFRFRKLQFRGFRSFCSRSAVSIGSRAES